MTTLGARENFVRLRPGVPTVVKVREAHYEDREIKDSITGQPKILRTLVLDLVELNGQPETRPLSFVSKKVFDAIDPLLKAGQFLQRSVTIVWNPRGFATEYEVRVL